MEILELKNNNKSSPEGLSSRFEQADERIYKTID